MLALTGCTAFVYDDAAQCESLEDCTFLNDATTTFVCDADQVCVPAEEVPCQTSTECVALLDSATASCVMGRCTQVARRDCHVEGKSTCP